MAELDAEVAVLKKRIGDAQKARARAEQQAAIARDRLETTRTALRDEFGIADEDAIPVLEEKLRADLAAEVRTVRELLDRAEEQ